MLPMKFLFIQTRNYDTKNLTFYAIISNNQPLQNQYCADLVISTFGVKLHSLAKKFLLCIHVGIDVHIKIIS